MTQLSCCADTCGHNKSGYCCLNCVEVGGIRAGSAESTCCNSFVEKSGTFTNDTQLPSPYSDIKCEAENCIYNSNHHCEAYNIDMSGHAASYVEDTLCSTFTLK